ncbi:hypothetical protein VTL71DRAFT_14054 [Oculimacula yallundae]|uniref:Uncharacterized protein n=1 Tax=Oculimacula yallundae TaxID=86028 RepID=A0ABR4CIQ9_9HELO
MFSHNALLHIILAFASFTSAQQPTPFIPATHYSIVPSQTAPPSPRRTRTGTVLPSSLPITHFFPQLDATFRYPNTNTNSAGDASSVWQALSSVQSTWTAGAEYPKITAAVYEAAPESARSSLSMSGYNWDQIVQEPWYSDVDSATQELVLAQEDNLLVTFDSMVSVSRAVRASAVGMGTVMLGGLMLVLMIYWLEL